MTIHQVFSSRINTELETYVGDNGRLFYDEQTGQIRISDAATAGGQPIPITIATNSRTGAILPGTGLEVEIIQVQL